MDPFYFEGNLENGTIDPLAKEIEKMARLGEILPICNSSQAEDTARRYQRRTDKKANLLLYQPTKVEKKTAYATKALLPTFFPLLLSHLYTNLRCECPF